MTNEEKNKPKFMVLARHMGMPGGVIDYGLADIKEFFESFEEADKYASRLFERTGKDVICPMIWILKCRRTYRREGVIDD